MSDDVSTIAPGSTTGSAIRVVLPIAAGAAIVVNLLLLLIGSAAGASMRAGTIVVGPVPVVAATALMFAVGTLVVWLVARRRPAAIAPLAWAGLGLAVVSVAAPLTMASDLATGLTLAPMHLVAGVARFLALRRIDAGR